MGGRGVYARLEFPVWDWGNTFLSQRGLGLGVKCLPSFQLLQAARVAIDCFS